MTDAQSWMFQYHVQRTWQNIRSQSLSYLAALLITVIFGQSEDDWNQKVQMYRNTRFITTPTLILTVNGKALYVNIYFSVGFLNCVNPTYLIMEKGWRKITLYNVLIITFHGLWKVFSHIGLKLHWETFKIFQILW